MNLFSWITKKKEKEIKPSLLFIKKPFERVNDKEFLIEAKNLLQKISSYKQDYQNHVFQPYFLGEMKKELEKSIQEMDANLYKLEGLKIIFEAAEINFKLHHRRQISEREMRNTLSDMWKSYKKKEYKKEETYFGEDFEKLDKIVLETERLLKKANLKRGLEQLHEILEKSYSFFEVLKEKFSPEELAFIKYQGIIVQVLGKVGGNLSKIGFIEVNWPMTDLKELEEKIMDADELENKELKARKISFLNEKTKQLKEENERLENLYINNLEVLTEFGEAIIELSRIQTTDLEKERKTEELILELKQSVRLMSKFDLSKSSDPVN